MPVGHAHGTYNRQCRVYTQSMAPDVREVEGPRAGLGAELIDRFEDAIENIRNGPQTWPGYPDWHGEPVLRSRSVKTLRYRIVYYVRDETIRVIAYAHTSREPGYWHARART